MKLKKDSTVFERNKVKKITNKNIQKILLLSFGLIIIFLVGLYGYKQYTLSQINSFAECVKAGLPILETYPAQCKVNGKTFVETNSNKPMVTTPKPSLVTPTVSNIINELITNSLGRITKKPFGIYITPQTSPVQPEKFTGYHTGTDFEASATEANIAVPISAICDGNIVHKNTVDGYGGVIIQECTIKGQLVTVLYGHIDLSSASYSIGNRLIKGDFLANLAPGFSTASAGERKHLHLGIHLGNNIEFRGYVQTKSELSNWLDYQVLSK